MSARAKKPTTTPPPVRAKSSTARGHASGELPVVEDKPDLDSQRTNIFDSGRAGVQAPPDRSGPIQMVSMKTPGVAAARVPFVEHPRPQVKLRAISEVTPTGGNERGNLGRLAPPRDPAAVRARRRGDYVIYACIAIVVASAVAIAIWFVAR